MFEALRLLGAWAAYPSLSAMRSDELEVFWVALLG